MLQRNGQLNCGGWGAGQFNSFRHPGNVRPQAERYPGPSVKYVRSTHDRALRALFTLGPGARRGARLRSGQLKRPERAAPRPGGRIDLNRPGVFGLESVSWQLSTGRLTARGAPH